MRHKQLIKNILVALLSLIATGCFPYMGDLYQVPEIKGQVILLNGLAPVQGVKVQHYGLKESAVKTGENGEFTLDPVAEFGVSVMMMGYVLNNFYVEFTPPNASTIDQPPQKTLLYPVRANVKLDHFDHVQTVILFDPKTAAGEFATITSKDGLVIDLNQWYRKFETDSSFDACDRTQAFSTAMLLSNQQKLRRLIKENHAEYEQYEDVFIEQLFSFTQTLKDTCKTKPYDELDIRERNGLVRAWDHINTVFDNFQ